MTIDIDKLRAAAKAATPGPWGVLQAPHTHGSWWEIYADGPSRIGVLSRDNAIPNGRHIAACDPTTIIALCDEVARLRQELGQPLETERECERLNQRAEELGNLLIESAKRVETAERIEAAAKAVVAAVTHDPEGVGGLTWSTEAQNAVERLVEVVGKPKPTDFNMRRRCAHCYSKRVYTVKIGPYCHVCGGDEELC